MRTSPVSASPVSNSSPPNDASGEQFLSHQCANSVHAPILSEQLYFQQLQVIDRSCLEQVLRDARRREAERITARGRRPVKGGRKPRGIFVALKHSLLQLAELL